MYKKIKNAKFFYGKMSEKKTASEAIHGTFLCASCGKDI
jgi:hypothetical protein